jgi:Na+/H+-dicarboxylate symporter
LLIALIAIYFPAVVVFMAETQDIHLNAGQYVIVVLLATLSSIATTPIPSSSLVLTVIICQAVDVPMTGSKLTPHQIFLHIWLELYC